MLAFPSRRLFTLRALARTGALLATALLSGCTPVNHRIYTLSAFEKSQHATQHNVIGIELTRGSEIRLRAAEPTVDALQRSTHVDSTARSTYVVGKATHAAPILRCATGLEIVGAFASRGLDMIDPQTGFRTLGQYYFEPGRIERQHVESRVIEVGEIEYSESEVRAYVLPVQDGNENYFCRNDNYERLLRSNGWLVHPGYSAITGGFWVTIPRKHIQRLHVYLDRTASPVPPAGDGTEDSVNASYVSDAWWPCAEFEDRLSDAVVRRAEKLGLTFEGIAQVMALSDAADRALCLASQDRDDRALLVLEQTIREVSTEMLWAHDSLYKAYAATLLIRVSRGEIDEAVDAVANLYHMSAPGWTIPAEPAFLIDQRPSALGSFFRVRHAELARQWPRLIHAVERARS